MSQRQSTFDEQSSVKKTIIDEIHKPARKRYKRRAFIQHGINDTLQMDLVEMIPYARTNKGYKYILMVIDCFSKKAFARPLKTKTGKEVSEVTKSILDTISTPPKNVQTDLGKEFYNTHFRNLMKERGINHYSTYTEMKASIVERLNRSIKGMMWRHFGYSGTYKWHEVLDNIIELYNDKYHRTIKMSPNQVNEDNENQLLETVYSGSKVILKKKHKYKVNDKVRISKYKGVFSKGYTSNWSTEIFQIVKVQDTNPTTYLLKDDTNTPIKGSFYEAELLKVKYPNTYVIEKILKTKGRKILVKYLGLDNSYNTWINKKDLI